MDMRVLLRMPELSKCCLVNCLSVLQCVILVFVAAQRWRNCLQCLSDANKELIYLLCHLFTYLFLFLFNYITVFTK